MAASLKDILRLVKAGKTGPRVKLEERPPEPPRKKNTELSLAYMRKYRRPD